jgi:hypothetical protein
MQATTAQTAAQTATAREDTVLALFGGLDSGLQFLIYKHMYALERAERRAIAYRARRLIGFCSSGFVSEQLEWDFHQAVEDSCASRRAQAHPRSGPRSPHAIAQRLITCLRAVVGEVFTPDSADGLNLGAADWRSVVASLRLSGPVVEAGLLSVDHWRQQVNACTPDGLHNVFVRTAGLADETVDESSDESSDEEMDETSILRTAFQGRRMLRVNYEGPQRFERGESFFVA